MADNFITGTIPSEIGTLSSLDFIDLSQTTLVGSIPTEISRLASLTSLFLREIALTGTIPALPPSITYCYVLKTNIGGPLPRIGQLTNLIEFEVYDNRVRYQIVT